MFSKVISRVIAAVIVLTATGSSAGESKETVDLLGSQFILEVGETKTLSLNSWRSVFSLFIQADGESRDAVFEVVANGIVKGTVYVPAHDPSYVVTIADYVDSLQLRHLHGGRVRVRNIKAVQSPDPMARTSRTHSSALNAAGSLARRVIEIADHLEDHIPYRDFSSSFFPIKKKAGIVVAFAAGRGTLSGRTRQALLELRDQMESSRTIFQALLMKNDTFELAVELLGILEKIDQVTL